MKILFVTTCYPTKEYPQYCIFLEQQALALKKLGHTVDVCLVEGSNNFYVEKYVYNEINVNRVFVTGFCKYLSLLPIGLKRKEELQFKDIIKNGYDVVSFHFGDMHLFKSIAKLCKKNNIPLAHHFHGLNIWQNYFDLHPILTKYENFFEKKLYKKLSATINVSQKVKEEFVKKITSVPSYVVYNGVDINRFPFIENRQYFNNKTIKILCVANLIAIKGQAYLIEAVAKLNNMGYKIDLTLAGRGTDENKLKQLANNRSVKVNFTGYLLYDDISKLMSKNDIFIMPSFFEALGCVYLEAMSTGLITVGVRTQGIDEIIIDGKNGFLVEPKSVDSIVNVVEKIIKMSQDNLKDIAYNGRKTSENYTWDNSAKTLEKIYDKVIGESNERI